MSPGGTGSRKSQMSMVSSSEPLTIWKSSICRLLTQCECSCDKQVRINDQSHGQATQISLTKCLHMNDVITVTNVLVSYPGSCWVRFWYRCDLIVYLPFMTKTIPIMNTQIYQRTHKLYLQSYPVMGPFEGAL